MALKLLGKFNFRIVLFVGILLVLITIFLCYGLAVSLGHKDAWLPTISECGVLPPEMYFFRWGILVGGLLLVVEAVVLHTASRVSNTAAWLGGIAGFLLTGVAVVSADDDITLHLSKFLPNCQFGTLNCLLYMPHEHGMRIRSGWPALRR